MSNNINYSDTISCTTTNQCSLKYGSNENWVCDNNNQKCVKKCYSDSDCGDNKYCMYNSDLGYNKCNDKQYESLSLGCLPESDLNSIKSSANVTSVESNSSTIDKCVDWSRNQTCDGDGKCNYMVYKEAIDTPIDWSNFTANVTCNNSNYSITSKLKTGCQENGTYSTCVYDESNSLLTSALQDAVNELNYNGDCTDYELNYSYKCQNEPSGQTSTNNVTFKANEIDNVSVNIKCPIGDPDDIKPVCIATNLSDSQKSKFSSNTNPNTCSYPIYNVPNYYSSSQLDNMAETQYSNEYNKISEELEQNNENEQYLIAKKVMIQQRMNGNSNFSLNDAYNLIEEEKQQNKSLTQSYYNSIKNNFDRKLINNMKMQNNDAINISKLVNEKIIGNKRDLNGLDKKINNITNKIYKSQKTEQLNVKVTYFLSIFLLVVFILAIFIFIFIVVKNYQGNSNTGN